MEESIKINFTMKINHGNDQHVISFENLGKRYERLNKTFYKFDEPVMEENKVNHIIIGIDDQELTILRSGHVHMKQSYRKNEMTYGVYKNDYIFSPITNYTYDFKADDETIYLNYDMLNENDVIGNYEMKIKIEGVGQDE
jgi:uncharacterized beta-barrel protein YwiB (DUF1934 family)